MDAFKAQFERIRQQLAGLTATQKMLVTALVAIMVMTMLYWGKYAGNPEMVPVLDQVLSDDDIGPIDHQLELANIPYKVDAGKILVPADRKSEILATLMFDRVLPQDTHSAFETMSKQLNPFSPASDRDAAYTEATSMELSDLIGRFPGVGTARVIINAKNDQRIEGSIPPSATVFITTKGDAEQPKVLVRAAADGVAHAVSGLSPSQISVIINGASMRVPDADNNPLGGADDLMEIREKSEARLEEKIRNEFRWIAGLTVTVTCDVENSSTKSQSDEYDKSKSFVQPQKTTENTEETANTPAGPREPGVTANTDSGANGSASIDGGGGGGTASSSTISKTENLNQIFAPHIYTEKTTPAGSDIVKAATVRVPLSYFANVFKQLHPKIKDPTDADMDALTKMEMAKIRQGVERIAGLKSDDDVSVDSYADVPAEALAMATAPAVQSAALSTVSGHAKEIGVAVLAVISLFMMATMVRKSSPAALVMPSGLGSGDEPGPSKARAGLNALGGLEAIAGEVGAGGGALDGMEMDDDAVRTQQMLDQVSTMVKENPDGAAALVKRWLSRA